MVQSNRRFSETYTFAWCRLSGNGYVLVHNQPRLQCDDARHVKKDGSGTIPIGGSLSETALAIIVQIGHIDNLSTTSAVGKASIALSTWESKVAGTETPHLTLGDITILCLLIYSPIIGVSRLCTLLSQCVVSCASFMAKRQGERMSAWVVVSESVDRYRKCFATLFEAGDHANSTVPSSASKCMSALIGCGRFA